MDFEDIPEATDEAIIPAPPVPVAPVEQFIPAAMPVEIPAVPQSSATMVSAMPEPELDDALRYIENYIKFQLINMNYLREI